MKRHILRSVLIVTLVIATNITTAQTIFQKTFGFYGIGASVQQTADGGYIITGSTNLGAGGSDLSIIKTNSNGDTLWTKTLGGTGADYGSWVQQTANGGYIITGGTSLGAGSEDVYLVRLDLNGDTLWTKAYGGTGWDEGTFVQGTSDGGYLITGYTTSFSAGGYDAYLIKTNSLGDTLWTKTFGGPFDDYGSSGYEVADGGYVMIGYMGVGAGLHNIFAVRTDVNGDTLWTKTYGGTSNDYTGILGRSAQPTTDGGLIITGSTISFGAGSYDAYLIKTDSLGNVLWSKTYGGTEADDGLSVQQTIDGGYIITGRSYSFGPKLGQRNVYLIKTDAIGDTLWTRVFGDTIAAEGFAVSQTDDAGYIITGRTSDFGGQGHIYMIKTDSNGNSDGCYEYSTSTIVGNVATVIGSGAIVGNGGGLISSPAAIVSYPTYSDSILCTSLVSIKEKSETLMNVRIYPNPFNQQTTLYFQNPQDEEHTLLLYDMQGRLVRTITHINTDKVEIDRKNLINGLYIFQLATDGQLRATGKLMID